MNHHPDFGARKDARPAIPARAATAEERPTLFQPGSPILEGKDIAAMILATIMALGPLAAVAFGFGP